MDWFKRLRPFRPLVRLCVKVISAYRFARWMFDLWNDFDA